MSIVANIISTVLRSAVENKFESKLADELLNISIDGFSEHSISKIKDFIAGEKDKIDHVLSRESMKSMNIPEENIDYVVSEIKALLSKVDISDEKFRQCQYDRMKLSSFLWDEYCDEKGEYIEYGFDIQKGLFITADQLIKLVRQSEKFESDLLIHISNTVDDTNMEIKKITQYMEDNFNELDTNNQMMLDILYGVLDHVQSENFHHNVQKVESRTREYAAKWTANMFLNDFDKRDENLGVNIKLKDVYYEFHLPYYKWKENKKPSRDIKTLMTEHIDAKDKRMLLILGQPGIGKSTLITWITANIINTDKEILVYQFASDLRNINWDNTNNRHGILGDVLEELNLSNVDLNDKVLILDGFDEVNIGGDRGKILNQLNWNLNIENSSDNFSIIITCRENYFRELSALECNYITLQPWDQEQIQSFCAAYQKKCRSRRFDQRVFAKYQDILGIPLILYMILALDIPIKQEESIADVYDYIFSLEKGGIYDRRINKLRFGKNHPMVSEIKEQIYQISEEIAFWIFENNSQAACIPHEEYVKITESVAKSANVNREILLNNFKIGNYFKQVKFCEGIDSEQLYFVHRSIYEYFVAEYILNLIGSEASSSGERLSSVLGRIFQGNVLSKEIIEFLKHKIIRNDLSGAFGVLRDSFQIMLRDGMTFYADKCRGNVIKCEMRVFANMMEMLHLWEESYIDIHLPNVVYYLKCNALKLSLMNLNLAGIDLSGAALINANLSHAILAKANLTGAVLRGAVLTDAHLVGAVLRGANLRRADLRCADLRKAILLDVDLSYANLEGMIIDENQTGYLKKRYDLHGIRVYVQKTEEIVSYDEYRLHYPK